MFTTIYDPDLDSASDPDPNPGLRSGSILGSGLRPWDLDLERIQSLTFKLGLTLIGSSSDLNFYLELNLDLHLDPDLHPDSDPDMDSDTDLDLDPDSQPESHQDSNPDSI